MNKAYKVIWSKAHNCYVVVSELAKRHAKAPSVASVKGVVASVTAAAALSVMLGGYGVAWAEDAKKGTFDNFANADELQRRAEQIANETFSFYDANRQKTVTISEFKNSNGLESICAHNAYALGYSGRGVILGVIEGGAAQSSHRDLNSNVHKGKEDGQVSSHATHVAGTIAAGKDQNTNRKNMHGVAYNSTVYSYNAGQSGQVFDERITAVNFSMGPTTDEEADGSNQRASRALIDSGAIVVHSMGNSRLIDGEAGINENKGYVDYTDKNSTNSYISVVGSNPAVDTNDATFLLYCTNLAKNESKTTVTAPGMNINSTVSTQNNGYDYMSGTSMSAPHVTGSVGLVKEALPYLNNKMLTDTILTTANKDFELAPFYCLVKDKEGNDAVLGALNPFDTSIQKVILIFPKEKDKQDITVQDAEKALRQIYKNYIEGEDFIKNEWIGGIHSADDFINYVTGKKDFLETIELTREEIFGQGLLDVGRAVQGIGAIDVDRLDSDKDRLANPYSGQKDYMYQVNTGESTNNYNNRKFSIWSNDITEKNTGKNLHAGIAKSGNVDLILLGDNSYTGHTLVTEGKLQIVKGVAGDVVADGGKVVDNNVVAEINGKAKNVMVINGGTALITDTITQRDSSEKDADFFNAALPKTTKVEIDGVLYAEDWTLVKEGDKIGDAEIKGSTIDIKLNNKDSIIRGNTYIRGITYNQEKSTINAEVANGATIDLNKNGNYVNHGEIIGKNIFTNLSLNNEGHINLSNNANYSTLEISKLYGNNGLFTVKTDLANRKSDSIIVGEADGTQNHGIQIVDSNGNIGFNGFMVKVAEAPSNVSFTGKAMPVDLGVQQYTPQIDYLPDSAERSSWWFYGFDDSSRIGQPEINGIAKGNYEYTTDTVINNSINAYDDTTIKVDKASGKAMQINVERDKDDYSHKFGVHGSMEFAGQGPVAINVNAERDLTAGVGVDTDYIDNNDTYNFTSQQTMDINMNYNKSGYPFGIYAPKEDGNVVFEKNLNINMEQTDDGGTGRPVGIETKGNFEVKGDVNITINAPVNSEKSTSTIMQGIDSEGTLQIGGNTTISLQGGNGRPQLINVNKGEANFLGNVNLLVDGKSTQYKFNSVQGVGLNVGDSYSKNEAKVNIKGNLNIELKNYEANFEAPDSIRVTENSELNVDGNLSVRLKDQTAPHSTGEDAIYNQGKIKTRSLIAEKSIINNWGTMKIEQDITANKITNSDSFEVEGNLNTKDLTNSGHLYVNGTIKTDSFREQYGSYIRTDEMIVNDWYAISNLFSDREYPAGDIKSLTITGNGGATLRGKYNINNLYIENGDRDNSYSQFLTFEKGAKINNDKSGTVKINSDSYCYDTTIKLSNPDSYMKGKILASTDDFFLSISNGAQWMPIGMNTQYDGAGTFELMDKGIIVVPEERRYTNYQVLKLDKLVGTGGIFRFPIHQESPNSSKIYAGLVTVVKNETKDAKHTIQLTPTTADFILANGVKIDAFPLVHDESTSNNGYALNFDIENFDAGVYNYTPTLTKERGYYGNVWSVTDIQVTSAEPESESKDDLLTIDTTKLTDADKTNKYGSDTVYLQKVDTGRTLGADSIVTNDVKEVTGSDKLHGGIVAEGKNDLVLAGDNSYQGPTVSRLQDGATLQVVKGVQGDAMAEDGGTLALHGSAKGVYAADNSDVLITDTVARKVINASDTKEQKEAKEKFNTSVPEKTMVNVTGGVFAAGGNVKVDLSNGKSVVRGPLYTGENGSTDITLDNGAKVIAEKGSGKYKGTDYAGNNKVTRLNINNGSMIDISGDGEISELHVETLNGAGGVFGLGIHQEAKDSGNITADKIIIDKNETKGASHTIQFTPDQADFLLSRGTKVNAFDVAEDHSEPNGGYAVKFAANNFDAGVYNYTPTIGSEKDGGNVNRWKITDIRITGSEPTPTPSPTPGPDPTPSPVPSPVPKPVLSNLTYNTQAAAINNYYRWRDEYNNLEKRLGDLRYSNEENGIWARTFRGHEDSGKYGLNSTYTAFQLGYDRKVETKKGGKWFIGGAVTSYDGKTSFDHLGRTENKSVGLALYGSYLGSKGHYVDIVARHSRLNTELDSYATGTGAKVSGDYHNWGSSIGVEYGRRIALKKGYFVQPQAELVYGHLNSVNYNLDDGSSVSQSGVSTWLARGGVTIGRQTKKGSVYASFSVLHDFGDDSRFTIRDKYGASYSSNTNMKDTWYELSIGGNAKLSENTYMYADVEKTFGSDVRTKWRYNVGVRCSF